MGLRRFDRRQPDDADIDAALVGPGQQAAQQVIIDRPEIDAFVVPGANFPTVASIPGWEREFRKPVVTSTQAAIWAMALALGGERVPGFGRLLDQMPAAK